MSSTVQGKEFAKALKVCARFTPRKRSNPILNSVRVAGGFLESTDLDAWVRVPVQGLNGDAPMVYALPPLVASTRGAGSVSLSGPSVISEDGSRATVETFDAAEFPTAPEVDPDGMAETDAETFRTMVDRVAVAASTDYTRPEQTAVCIEITDGAVGMTAVNGHRLHHIGPMPTGGTVCVLVPAAALVKIAASVPKSGPVSLWWNGRHFRVDAGGSTYVTRLVDGPFPPWVQAVPAGGDGLVRFEVETAGLLAAAERCAAVASTATRMIKVEIGPDAASVSVPGVMEIPLAVRAPESVVLGINGSYLVDALKRSPATVEMETRGGGSAVVMRADGWLVLIMPLRLS